MSQPTVLLIGDLTHTNSEWNSLQSKYNLLEFRTGTRVEFLNNLRQGTYKDVVALYRSNTSTSVTGPFDEELISLLPSSLKFICHNGAGYDNIDVGAVNQRQIGVSSTPVAVDDATADVGIFLMLGALRVAQVSLMAVKQERWRGETPLGRDPKGKVLGILGMGGIGRAFAHRARAFGVNIIYHNRTRLPQEVENAVGAIYVDFDTLLSTSDILSLNLALNPSTRHIISAPQLQQMKKDSVIINTARGGLINESDLVSALDSGHLSAVGLDVFENEPEIHPGLLKNDRAFLLPHVGTNTLETQKEMELLVLRNLESSVDTGSLLTRIGEQKGKGFNWVNDERRSDAGKNVSRLSRL